MIWRAPLLILAYLYQTTLIAMNRERVGVRSLVIGGHRHRAAGGDLADVRSAGRVRRSPCCWSGWDWSWPVTAAWRGRAVSRPGTTTWHGRSRHRWSWYRSAWRSSDSTSCSPSVGGAVGLCRHVDRAGRLATHTPVADGLASAGPVRPRPRERTAARATGMERLATWRSPMKFCMITTFFGAHSFGGDAAYVDRLSQALCRRGHEVHVYYCVDAFNAVRGDHPLREYTPPPGLHLHPLKSPFGILSPLATQATGQPWFKADALREVLDDPETDVVHFHNISLVGGPGVLGLGANRRAVRIMTAHEHWLICPMHLLWKYDQQICDAPNCIRCSLAGGRPPQVWRWTRAIEQGLATPRRAGLPQPACHGRTPRPRTRSVRADGPTALLPPRRLVEGDRRRGARASRSAVSRRRRAAGQDEGIPAVDPDDALPPRSRPCGSRGPAHTRPSYVRMAQDLPNVHFEGLSAVRRWPGCSEAPAPWSSPRCSPRRSATSCSRHLRYGHRSSSTRRPAPCWRRACRAAAGSAIVADIELLTALRRIIHDPDLRDELADRGFARRMGEWSEARHLDRYLALIDQAARRGRAGRSIGPP